jgi:hypothetical protein
MRTFWLTGIEEPWAPRKIVNSLSHRSLSLRIPTSSDSSSASPNNNKPQHFGPKNKHDRHHQNGGAGDMPAGFKINRLQCIPSLSRSLYEKRAPVISGKNYAKIYYVPVPNMGKLGFDFLKIHHYVFKQHIVPTSNCFNITRRSKDQTLNKREKLSLRNYCSIYFTDVLNRHTPSTSFTQY